METGGEVVGDTRSGKVVIAFLPNEVMHFPHPSTKNFTLEDHYEAFAIFAHLMLRAKRRFGENSEDYSRYMEHATAHLNVRGLMDRFEKIRRCSGVIHAFEDRELGRKLCRPEYRDI